MKSHYFVVAGVWLLWFWSSMASSANNLSATEQQLDNLNQHFINSSQRLQAVQWLQSHASAIRSAAKVTHSFGQSLSKASYGGKSKLEQAHWQNDQKKLQGQLLVVGPMASMSDVTVAAMCQAHAQSANRLLESSKSLSLTQLDQVTTSMAICHNRMNISMGLMRQLVLQDKVFSEDDYLAFGEYFNQIKKLFSSSQVNNYSKTPLAQSLRREWVFQQLLTYQPVN